MSESGLVEMTPKTEASVVWDKVLLPDHYRAMVVQALPTVYVGMLYDWDGVTMHPLTVHNVETTGWRLLSPGTYESKQEAIEGLRLAVSVHMGLDGQEDDDDDGVPAVGYHDGETQEELRLWKDLQEQRDRAERLHEALLIGAKNLREYGTPTGVANALEAIAEQDRREWPNQEGNTKN